MKVPIAAYSLYSSVGILALYHLARLIKDAINDKMKLILIILTKKFLESREFKSIGL